MRDRKAVEKEAKNMNLKGALILEVLLDIRELLASRERREGLELLRDK